MRPLFALLILLAAVASVAKDKTIPELVQEAASAKPHHQPELYARIAELQLRTADKLYRAGNSDAARSCVEDVQTYSTKAADAAIDSGSDLKKTEISLRKMESHLQDMVRGLDYSDQLPVQNAADKLDALRGQLLTAMFGKKAELK